MNPRYDPSGVEARWQDAWEDEGLYAAGAGARHGETYAICVPPPNVTGDLHMSRSSTSLWQRSHAPTSSANRCS